MPSFPNSVWERKHRTSFREGEPANTTELSLVEKPNIKSPLTGICSRQGSPLQHEHCRLLRTVARNACIGLLRSRSRRLRHEKEAAKAEQIQGEDEATDLRDELETALEQFAPDLRNAVQLKRRLMRLCELLDE